MEFFGEIIFNRIKFLYIFITVEIENSSLYSGLLNWRKGWGSQRN